MVKQDLVLLKDVNYFGRFIYRGSTFKQMETNKNEYELWENNGGILMHCPAVRVHFSVVSDEYFVKQYENAPKVGSVEFRQN